MSGSLISTLHLDPRDNALVALRDLSPGEEVEFRGEKFPVAEPIAAKHKLTVSSLEKGDEVTLYGVLVGKATQPVERGGLLHTHNLVHAAHGFGMEGYETGPAWSPPDVSPWQERTFRGFRRPGGKVGTANLWLVLPMVFCENRNLKVIERAFSRALGYDRFSGYEDYVSRLVTSYQEGASVEELTALRLEEREKLPARARVFPGVDGVRFLAHEAGCGCDRGDSDALCGLLAGYAAHPNVAGVTVLSLGCQNAKVSIFEEEFARRTGEFDKPLIILEQQKFSSERDFLETALRETFLGMAQANEWQSEDCPLSELCVGVECGGSDGFSGISANPAIGAVADRIVGLGGKVILSEFPELCGVEGELIQRCADRETAQRFVELMESYNARAEAVDSSFSMNPSPGNIQDGLITDAIKSAGAAKKGGTSPVVDVIDYPGAVRKNGLTLLCTPGNDVESTTAMAGAGANLMLFSTGLGTPTGNPVCPVIKVSSNHTTARKQADMIDFDAGGIIEGSESLEESAARLLELALAVASGEPTKAMLLGQNDFIPWKRGISL